MGRSLSWRRSALALSPPQAALALLGATLRADSPEGTVALRITEVEAYGGADDPGSHAFRGQTKRNGTMFGPAGFAYVYFTYGMHWCLNVVCGDTSTPGAVLLRAGHVTEGIALARLRRPGASDRDLARGPARLTKAVSITGVDDGLDLLSASSRLHLERRSDVDPTTVVWGPRVGVAGAGAVTPWRAYLRGEPTVSLYRPAVARKRSRPPQPGTP